MERRAARAGRRASRQPPHVVRYAPAVLLLAAYVFYGRLFGSVGSLPAEIPDLVPQHIDREVDARLEES